MDAVNVLKSKGFEIQTDCIILPDYRQYLRFPSAVTNYKLVDLFFLNYSFDIEVLSIPENNSKPNILNKFGCLIFLSTKTITKISLNTSGGRSFSGFLLKSKYFNLPSMKNTRGTNSLIKFSAKFRRLMSCKKSEILTFCIAGKIKSQ